MIFLVVSFAIFALFISASTVEYGKQVCVMVDTDGLPKFPELTLKYQILNINVPDFLDHRHPVNRAYKIAAVHFDEGTGPLYRICWKARPYMSNEGIIRFKHAWNVDHVSKEITIRLLLTTPKGTIVSHTAEFTVVDVNGDGARETMWKKEKIGTPSMVSIDEITSPVSAEENTDETVRQEDEIPEQAASDVNDEDDGIEHEVEFSDEVDKAAKTIMEDPNIKEEILNAMNDNLVKSEEGEACYTGQPIHAASLLEVTDDGLKMVKSARFDPENPDAAGTTIAKYLVATGKVAAFTAKMLTAPIQYPLGGLTRAVIKTGQLTFVLMKWVGKNIAIAAKEVYHGLCVAGQACVNAAKATCEFGKKCAAQTVKFVKNLPTYAMQLITQTKEVIVKAGQKCYHYAQVAGVAVKQACVAACEAGKKCAKAGIEFACKVPTYVATGIKVVAKATVDIAEAASHVAGKALKATGKGLYKAGKAVVVDFPRAVKKHGPNVARGTANGVIGASYFAVRAAGWALPHIPIATFNAVTGATVLVLYIGGFFLAVTLVSPAAFIRFVIHSWEEKVGRDTGYAYEGTYKMTLRVLHSILKNVYKGTHIKWKWQYGWEEKFWDPIDDGVDKLFFELKPVN